MEKLTSIKKSTITHRSKIYKGSHTAQIAFPLGGIGAGTIDLNGSGGLQNFAIRNIPALTALRNKYREACFAILSIKNNSETRVIEGPFAEENIYEQGLRSLGYLGTGMYEGLPRFRKNNFRGEYPFAYVDFSDQDIPLIVSLRAYNPFIPLDDINSGIPCAILEYTLINPTEELIEYSFSYHATHLAPGSDPGTFTKTRNEVIQSGIYFDNLEDTESSEYGSAAIGLIGFNPKTKGMWYRGDWFDAVTMLWSEITEGAFGENNGNTIPGQKGLNGGSILIDGKLQPGDTITYPIVVSWYTPNINYGYGVPGKCDGIDCGDDTKCNIDCWHPFYSTLWKDAKDVFEYMTENYISLRNRTESFHEAFFGSTLPEVVMDAVSANLGIIKSPTVLRQSSGNLWGWEGCGLGSGCCHGSCTHVWNYAQSISHLFPHLEKTLREQEYIYSMNEQGHVNFRSALPEGPTTHEFHPAADGQLGGIMKTYREWQISGDTKWLEYIFPYTKRSMDYCISRWDPNNKGVLEEPHHNTYDIEFWGPDGMCTNFYLGALVAMREMCRALGHEKNAMYYNDLAMKGAKYLDEVLFNGEYYEQQVVWDGLADESFMKELERNKNNLTQEDQLLRNEGPKYQYGKGCIADGVFGIILARLCGLEPIQNPKHVRSHLNSIFHYNFKKTLQNHPNPQRPGFALGNDSGVLLCTWPHGNRPKLPFIYSDEVWTGIEYQIASHMFNEGMISNGLAIVRGIRKRYDGKKRNPWAEYECGNHYARAMASYGLLIGLTGFSYSAVTKELSIYPKLKVDPFIFFFSTASGWGTIKLLKGLLEIEVKEGFIAINRIRINIDNKQIDLIVSILIQACDKVEIIEFEY